MTDKFREIEQSYEAKFKLDEELRFKVRSRRNKLFGLWAAERLGKTREQAPGYARRLVDRCIEAPGTSIVIEDVAADLAAAGVRINDSEIHAAYSHNHAVSLQQLLGEFPTALDRDHVPVGG